MSTAFDCAEYTTRTFDVPELDWETPGQLAKAIEPTKLQTPALDLIDEYLVKVEAGGDRSPDNQPATRGREEHPRYDDWAALVPHPQP